MEVIKLLVLAGIFFALTPGILVKLPSGGSVLKVAAAHAILFGLVYLVATHLFQALEGFVVPIKISNVPLIVGGNANAIAITNAAAGSPTLAPLLYTPSYPGLVPGLTSNGISAIGIQSLPKGSPGFVVDLSKATSDKGPFSCIPVPSQYILPPAPAASLAQTPKGGGWFNKQNNQIIPSVLLPSSMPDPSGGPPSKLLNIWCPPGYVNNRDIFNIRSSYGSPGACVVAPTTATSLIKNY